MILSFSCCIKWSILSSITPRVHALPGTIDEGKDMQCMSNISTQIKPLILLFFTILEEKSAQFNLKKINKLSHG